MGVACGREAQIWRRRRSSWRSCWRRCVWRRRRWCVACRNMYLTRTVSVRTSVVRRRGCERSGARVAVRRVGGGGEPAAEGAVSGERDDPDEAAESRRGQGGRVHEGVASVGEGLASHAVDELQYSPARHHPIYFLCLFNKEENAIKAQYSQKNQTNRRASAGAYGQVFLSHCVMPWLGARI